MINQTVRKKNPGLVNRCIEHIALVINQAGIIQIAYIIPKIIHRVIVQSTYLRFWISSYLTLRLIH